MLVIALTGGIGSGKTTVADLFASLGVPVIDTDVIARELVEPNSPALAQIENIFGKEILTDDGELNRAKLREIVFTNPDKRKQLESILHPLIRGEVRERTSALQEPYCIVVIPLLLETEQEDHFDRVLVVDTPTEKQVERVQARNGMDKTEIEAIMDAQVGREARLASAHEVIPNIGSIDDLKQHVTGLHHYYLKLANQAD